VLQAVAEMGGEGVIGKRLDASYESGRSSSWVKLKTTQRQEFIVAGYTDPRGKRSGLGALVLAVNNDQGQLVYAGSVGSGFGEVQLARLTKQLATLKAQSTPLLGAPRNLKAHWVEPRLVAEVSFTEWTQGGALRHPVFLGLRTDKEASRITREVALKLPTRKSPPAPAIAVTHGDRIIDPSTGLTKLHLVNYYLAAAPYLLQHIKGRPVALVRAPSGIAGTHFFQKQPDTLKFAGLKPVEVPGQASLLSFSSAEGIVHAAQLNVVEFHAWNARVSALEKPDRLVFDLDPGEGVEFERVKEAALLVRTLLDELALKSFVKTSGGKGLHVVVPLGARVGWDPVRQFSGAVVTHLVRVFPSRFVSKSGAHNRVGKIFIDVGRNQRGATTVAAYSARARPGLGVSVPLSWDELPSVNSGGQWTIVTAPERLEASAEAWRSVATLRQSIGAAAARIARA